jgi:hypothetical protein
VYSELVPISAPPQEVKLEASPEPAADPDAVLAIGETRLLLSHLSLLFGLFMLDNPANQRVLLAALPAAACAGERAKVDVLVGQAREFVYIYNAEGGEAAEEGESVRGVIRFLEGLREEAY